MTSGDSVTYWIHQLKEGDPAAAQALWQHYFHRLVTLALARPRGDSVFGAPDASGEAGFAGLQGNEPSPDLAAEVAEAYPCLLRKLGDDELRRIAVSKLQGWNNSDIAQQLGCAISTIERRLQLIRAIWKDGQDGEMA